MFGENNGLVLKSNVVCSRLNRKFNGFCLHFVLRFVIIFLQDVYVIKKSTNARKTAMPVYFPVPPYEQSSLFHSVTSLR